MTVTITVTPAKTLTRGWSGEMTLTMKNTGDENIRNLYVKINSAAGTIFSLFQAKCNVVGWANCLNTYTSNVLIFTDASLTLPAGQSKNFEIKVTVKSDAPIDAHTLTWHVQYEVY